MPSVAVSFIRPIIATRHHGITVADAHMSDHKVVRFRILGREPATVRLTGGELPEHQAAIEAWLAQRWADLSKTD